MVYGLNPMLEIIILIFLAKEIGLLASRKGLRSGLWKFYLVAGWIFMEIVGAVVGVIIFGPDNRISIFLVAVAFAITSYFYIKANLSKRPDVGLDEDISKIGDRE